MLDLGLFSILYLSKQFQGPRSANHAAVKMKDACRHGGNVLMKYEEKGF